MISIQKIAKKLKHLPPDKLIIISEFVEFLEQKAKRTSHFTEMSNREVLLVAEQTGSFEFLNDASEDIYTLEDGEPL
ncbi:MAG: hypothetical protein E3J87_05050 [Candidatus Cloacimonadota bacterium]|nr:MAG: hypothetical protein E3J87_05050 [Candidatus Cloacimonadota bacterium]